MSKSLLAGVGFMAIGMALIPVGDAIAKALSAQTAYQPHVIAWVRFLIGCIVMLPVALWKNGLRGLTLYFIFQQAVRGVLIVLTVVLIIKAVSLSPIADVFGAFFIGPVISVILSVLLLKATVSWIEWLSVAVGFLGVLMVVQPGFADSAAVTVQDGISGVYWALIAGVFYGAFLVSTRWAAGGGPALSQVALQFLMATLLLTPFSLSDFIATGVRLPWLLLLMGISSVMANLFAILALARASNAALAPVVYTQILAATAIGLFFFGDQLNTLAAIGLVVIVLSGLLKVRLPNNNGRSG